SAGTQPPPIPSGSEQAYAGRGRNSDQVRSVAPSVGTTSFPVFSLK
ncbi:hypothetical protein A2U01_0093271, partial [Trifolium medium]|nr:hypothetical protein [Trifolium medium]